MDSGREQQDWFEKQTSSANTQHLPVIKASAMQLQRVNRKCTEEMSNTTAPLQGKYKFGHFQQIAFKTELQQAEGTNVGSREEGRRERGKQIVKRGKG